MDIILNTVKVTNERFDYVSEYTRGVLSDLANGRTPRMTLAELRSKMNSGEALISHVIEATWDRPEVVKLWRAGVFELDGMPEGQQRFSGYTDGCRWNGFAMPAFTFEETQRIMAAWNGMNNSRLWDTELAVASYDPANDTFTFAWTGDLVTQGRVPTSDWETYDQFTGNEVTLDGVATKLYHCGAGSWTWRAIYE